MSNGFKSLFSLKNHDSLNINTHVFFIIVYYCILDINYIWYYCILLYIRIVLMSGDVKLPWREAANKIIVIIIIIIIIIIIRKYLQRILDVEIGSFTPLALGTNGGMETECQCFLKELALKIATKNCEPYATTMKWLRTLISFEIVKSVHLSIRGSRSSFRRDDDFIDDCKLNSRNVSC